jgi:hypothetical protein
MERVPQGIKKSQYEETENAEAASIFAERSSEHF